MPSKMHQENKLLHSNIATKHMAVIYRKFLTKDEHRATASSQHIKLKQAWQKCKRYQVHGLSENNNMSGFNIRKQCLEKENNILHEHIMAKKGMEINYS